MKKTCPVCPDHIEYAEHVKFCPEHGIPLRAPLAYYDGFISYRRDGGSELATIICTLLEMRFSKNFFLDVDRLGAERFDERLLECIAAAPNFILILTPGCLDRCRNEGDWLRREIEQALHYNKKIIQICKEGFAFPRTESLPETLRVLPKLHWVRYDNENRHAVLGRIAGFMAPSPLSCRVAAQAA
jgi:hypothetical protein